MGRWPRAGLIGAVVAAACLGAADWANVRELTGRRSDLQREVRAIARLVVTRIEGGLEKHVTAMRQMANFYASSRKVSDKAFHTYASNTLKMNPACLNIAYVDPAMHIQQTHPPDVNQWKPILDARSHPLLYRTVQRAASARRPTLSSPMPLFGGTWGFVLAEPVVVQGHLLGTLVGACRSEQYFDSLLPTEVNERYEAAVLESDRPIFASDQTGPSNTEGPSVSEEFSYGGVNWEVRLQPQEQVVHDRMSAGRSFYWTMACLFALACGALASAASLWAMEIATRLRVQRAALAETMNRLDGTKEQLIQAEKMTALGQLVAGVAHEINNPLTGIVGFSQLLMRQTLPPDTQKKLATIGAEAERMAKIVKNLLAFARRHAPEKQHLDLNRIIEETLALKAYHLSSRQIQVIKELDPSLPKTLLDANQIQQVLLNLLNNAEQAMIEAQRGKTIRLATSVAGDRIELRVSDDGPGVPQEIQERIFEPFFTTKKEGTGTGLGLSLCYGIVEEHGGKIRLESAPGEGATFIIELPVRSEPLHAGHAKHRSSQRCVPSMKVLVIDDEPSVRDFLVDVLTLGGHTVDRASDVPEALQKIAGGAHDLIITDLMMPRGTGLDIYDAVLRTRPHLAQRIVFTTGHAMGEKTLELLRNTGNDLVAKPCKIEEIENAIARAARR